jgi:methyl-accepting chemotaxis protein
MKLRISLAPAILLPVTATILLVVAFAMLLSSLSSMAQVESTLRDQQDQMIQVLAQQFAGSVRFAKMDVVTAALENYQKQPNFGLAAASAVDAQGKSLLDFGDRADLSKTTADVAAQALKNNALASVVEGNYHFAAYPAYYGKDNAIAGAVVMVWDISLRRAAIIGAQIQNGLWAMGIAVAGLACLGFFLVMYVARPIRALTAISTALADGHVETEVSGANRRDELGDLAAALEVFRNNTLKVRQMTDDEARRIVEAQVARQHMMVELQAAFGEVVDAANAGDFSRRVPASFPDDELNALAGSVNTLVETADRGLKETGAVLACLADADLTKRMDGQYAGAFADLQRDTNAVADKLTAIVGRLKKTSLDLKTATGEILAGANDLSERTTRQAATIEETSAAMEQLAETVLKNADRAGQASENAADVTAAATEGGAVMLEANAAMERITTSSGKISNIIGLIDDIAFQTNLLALNASVEAARAGEAGKGFAVVAIEVRRLAQSAAEASSEIKALIEQSATEVTTGNRLVAGAAEKLNGMLEAVKRNDDLLQSIAAESREQATAIAEVNTAVRQMDEMTQHNAALVEETNAAIEQTEAQAVELDQVVDIFNLVDAEAEARPAAPVRGRERQPAPSRERQPAPARERVKAAAKSYLSEGSAAIDKEWAEF